MKKIYIWLILATLLVVAGLAASYSIIAEQERKLNRYQELGRLGERLYIVRTLLEINTEQGIYTQKKLDSMRLELMALEVEFQKLLHSGR